jgi:hypothetical protein
VQALTVGEYKNKLKQKSQYVDFYIFGVEEGIAWANSMNQSKNITNLYCVPKYLALNIDNYKRVIEDGLEKYPSVYKDDIDVEVVLLRGLMRNFPCNS